MLPRGPAQSLDKSPQFSPVSASVILKTMSRPKQQHLRRRKIKKAHFPQHDRQLKQWYFATKIVLTYCEKNCSSGQEQTFEIRG